MGNLEEIGFWHLTLTSKGRLNIFPNETELRQALKKLAKLAAPYLVSFCIVDDHIHLVVYCSKRTVTRLPQALHVSLSSISSCQFNKSYLVPVTERTHLERLITYIVKQPLKHDLSEHPALHSGSCFLDLVGARSIGILGYPIISALPRFKLAKLFHELNLPISSLTPADDDQVKNAGVAAIFRASGSVFAIDPAFADNFAETVMARRVAVRLASSVGFPPAQISCHLKRTKRSVHRLRNDYPPPEELLTAVRRRLALERLVQPSAEKPGFSEERDNRGQS